jgi:hypothetical protein
MAARFRVVLCTPTHLRQHLNEPTNTSIANMIAAFWLVRLFAGGANAPDCTQHVPSRVRCQEQTLYFWPKSMVLFATATCPTLHSRLSPRPEHTENVKGKRRWCPLASSLHSIRITDSNEFDRRSLWPASQLRTWINVPLLLGPELQILQRPALRAGAIEAGKSPRREEQLDLILSALGWQHARTSGWIL